MRLALALFNSDGRGLFNFLHVFGHIALTAKERTKKQKLFEEATIANLRIPRNRHTPWLAFEWLSKIAEQLGKTEMRKGAR